MIDEYIDDFYINIHREMRVTPFVGMKQPAPSGSVMGLGAILLVKRKGKPAINHRYNLLINGSEIESGVTDQDGMAYIGIPLNRECQCIPKYAKKRLCDNSTVKCIVTIDEPHILEAFPLASLDS